MQVDYTLKKRKLDPADTKQNITDIHIHLLCCRYWMLKEWECANMSTPFWRMYHNSLSGAKIFFKDTWYELNPDTLVLIPPHTPFATSLKSQVVKMDNEVILGRRIEPLDKIEQIKANEMVDHLFIHFNIGTLFEMTEPQVFAMKCDQRHIQMIDSIRKDIIIHNTNIELPTVLLINMLILEILKYIAPHQSRKSFIDRRVLDAISYMRDNDMVRISNEQLASNANMATNAFARLFKDNTGSTIQQYLMKIRIEKACLLMHHSNQSIDDIALKCGFFDRHHFSKAFKQALNITPAYYMKKLSMMI